MIDFPRKDLELTDAVGVDSRTIVSALGPPLADALERLQARFAALSVKPSPTEAERLERDRLDSLLLELYAGGGLLARAGALVLVLDKLRRISALLERHPGDPEVAGRVLREAQLVRAFSQARLERHPSVSTAIDQLVDSVRRLADFTLQASALEGQSGALRQARTLRTVAAVAEDFPQPKTVGDAVAIILGHLSDSRLVKSAAPAYDALCRSHAQAIREDLWAVAERGFQERGSAATWKELSELDLVLESLRHKLADARIAPADRAVALGELYGLIGAARAQGARQQLDGLLAPVAEIIRSGILQEAHP